MNRTRSYKGSVNVVYVGEKSRFREITFPESRGNLKSLAIFLETGTKSGKDITWKGCCEHLWETRRSCSGSEITELNCCVSSALFRQCLPRDCLTKNVHYCIILPMWYTKRQQCTVNVLSKDSGSAQLYQDLFSFFSFSFFKKKAFKYLYTQNNVLFSEKYTIQAIRV